MSILPSYVTSHMYSYDIRDILNSITMSELPQEVEDRLREFGIYLPRETPLIYHVCINDRILFRHCSIYIYIYINRYFINIY